MKASCDIRAFGTAPLRSQMFKSGLTAIAGVNRNSDVTVVQITAWIVRFAGAGDKADVASRMGQLVVCSSSK